MGIKENNGMRESTQEHDAMCEEEEEEENYCEVSISNSSLGDD